MKKFWGIFIEVFAFILMAACFAVPLSVMAFFVSSKMGSPIPEATNLVACFLLCVIVLYIGVRIPIKKYRIAWSLAFGFGLYFTLSCFTLFGFAKNTISILSPFHLETPNSILIYVGFGVLLIAIVLAAEGRNLSRLAGTVRKRETPVAPRIEPTVRTIAAPVQTAAAPYTLPVQSSAPAQLSAPKTPIYVGASSVIEEPDAERPRKPKIIYTRDAWGNLVANEESDENAK